MSRRLTRWGMVAVAACAIAVAIPIASASGASHRRAASASGASHHRASSDQASTIKHVLLISVDGLHQSDLVWWVEHHPNTVLAKLTHGGAEYFNAHTSVPSDSDPGGTALMTGGDPRATGAYYDVAYSHDVFPPGTTSCSGPAPGGNAIYDSPDDILNAVPDLIPGGTGGPFPAFDEDGSVFPGGNTTGSTGGPLPGAILTLTPAPQSGLNPATFPVDGATCKPIMPWDYLKVNTIFGVIHGAGMRTAWSDKHAIYTSFNGHGSGGTSIDDFFGPEIDSQAVEPNGVPYPDDTDWAHDDAATKQYDGYKVQAVLNELNGYDHSGRNLVGTPAVLGMNFQTVSVAEKVDSPSTLTKNANGTYTESQKELAGYFPGTTIPRPLLQSAFAYVNSQLERMVRTIEADHLASSTAIIITAKHGQSPQDPLLLKRIKDGPIIFNINEQWCKKQNPTASPNPDAYCSAGLNAGTITPLIVAGTDDDLWQSYLSVKTQDAANFVKNFLWNHSAEAVLYNNDGNNTRGPNHNGTEMVPHSGLAQIYAGHEAAAFFGVPYSDPRYPDVFGRVQVGVVYTGGSKIAEHGGNNPADVHVPILVYAPGVVAPGVSGDSVGTKQVAPTILHLLGLNPDLLQAVQIEGTQILPGS